MVQGWQFQVSSFRFQVFKFRGSSSLLIAKAKIINLLGNEQDTRDADPGTRNLGTWNLKPETWNLKFGTCNLENFRRLL
jgi:hypothetical protein